MKKNFWMILLGVMIALVIFPSKTSYATGGYEGEDWKDGVSSLRDSLRILQAEVDSLRQQAPGLGEYMSTMQLHAAKLWFAVKARNWELGSYEVSELNETMDGAAALHASRNNVNISGVLQSVQETQILSLKNAMQSRNPVHFKIAYKQTLEACNGCHTSAGYKFIHIIPPTGQPVLNQGWSAH